MNHWQSKYFPAEANILLCNYFYHLFIIAGSYWIILHSFSCFFLLMQICVGWKMRFVASMGHFHERYSEDVRRGTLRQLTSVALFQLENRRNWKFKGRIGMENRKCASTLSKFHPQFQNQRCDFSLQINRTVVHWHENSRLVVQFTQCNRRQCHLYGNTWTQSTVIKSRIIKPSVAKAATKHTQLIPVDFE